jgi:predicted AlkP superfamily pyrophosphatase or phosphodiesterase
VRVTTASTSPGPGADGFAALPATVERLLTGAPGGLPAAMTAGVERAESVGVVLLDAFGMRFVERHADHPLLRRLDAVNPLASQFPSTTTAHVTTMHTGMPVGEHGLYEWIVYEPAYGDVMTPILFSPAGSLEPGTLRGIEMADVLPETTFYRGLEPRSVVLSPAAFSPSLYDSVALRGAELRTFPDMATGAAMFAEALREPGYAYLYWHMIDATGHLHGPDSPEFDAACVTALDALDAALRDGPALVLLTADHGQIGVDPSRVDYLDDLLPEIGELLAHAPAGSARDVFLHARPGRAEELEGALRVRLGERAEVRAAAGLFPDAGPRLRERMADVCVLPAPGRMAWLRSSRSVESRFRGHHGGMTPDESRTWLGAMILP